MRVASLMLCLVSASACHKHADPLPPPADQHAACAASLSAAMQRAKDAALVAEHRVPGPAEARMAHDFMQGQANVMTATCTATAWAPEALACFDAAQTDDDNKKCLATLTPAQTEAWHAAAQAAFSGVQHPRP